MSQGRGRRRRVGPTFRAAPILASCLLALFCARSHAEHGAAEGEFTILESAPMAEVSGDRKTAVILVNFSNNTSQPFTTSEAYARTFTNANSVNAYHNDNSYGKVSMSGNVFGWYTLAMTNTCNTDLIVNQAIAAADPYVYFPNYSVVILAFPQTSPACTFGGLGTVGTSCGNTADGYSCFAISWIPAPYYTLSTVGHEVGHNFGIWHANAYNCPGVPITNAGCSSVDYGDPFDIMGGNGQFNAIHKEMLGWFSSPNIATVTVSGTYSIEPLETATSGVKTLKAPKERDGSNNVTKWYYLEYRQPLGFDAGLFADFQANYPVVNGVSIRFPLSAGTGDTQLIDTNPGTITNQYNMADDAPLALGRIFVDTHSYTSIVTLSTSASGAQVYVDIENDVTAPAAISDLSGAAVLGGSIKASWTSTGDDGSLGALTAGVFRLFYSTVAADMTGLGVAASATATRYRLDISTLSVAAGSARVHTFQVQASGTYYLKVFTADEHMNWSPVSNEASVTVDATPPVFSGSVRDGSAADVDLQDSLTTLSANWDAASDPESGVLRYWYAIGLSSGGTEIADWTDNGLSLSFTRSGLSLSPGIRYFVSVRAENNSGVLAEAVNYAESPGLEVFQSTGTAKNWRGDEIAWPYTLPFSFPFYGVDRTSLYVHSNGLIDFNPGGVHYLNTTGGLASRARIAPLWDDLITDSTGGDIFIAESTGSVTVRWKGATYTGNYPVEFAVKLFKNGDIAFLYGPGNTNLTPTIGVSAGDNARYTLSRYNANTTLTNAAAVRWTRAHASDGVLITGPPGSPQVASVNVSSITVAWSPVSADDYVLEVSTGILPNAFSGNRSSFTTNGAAAGLAVLGLDPNTTYYLRAGAVFGGATTYAATTPASTSTLAAAPGPLVLQEGFEVGFGPGWGFSYSGANWSVVNNFANAHEGNRYAEVPSDIMNKTADMSLSVTVQDPGILSFHSWGNSETNYDFLRFRIDGLVPPGWADRSGSWPWTRYATLLSSGAHTLVWRYTTDNIILVGPVRVDTLEIPVKNYPAFLVTPDTGSIRLDWSANGNPPGTMFTALISTASDPAAPSGASVISSSTLNTFVRASGLSPNTTHYFLVKATNNNGVSTPYSASFATSTLAAVPGPPAGSTFTAVSASGLTVNWSSGSLAGGTNPLNTTLYHVQIATMSDFIPVRASSQTYNLSAVFSGLAANATYYAGVRAVNGDGIPTPFISLGSTATLVETPTRIVFEKVSTGTIVASAYAPTPAFSGLGRGISGTAIARDGAYEPWNPPGDQWTQKAGMLTARQSMTAAGLGGFFYAIGGDQLGTYDGMSTNEAYDPVTDSWSTKAPMPTARRLAAAAAAEGRIYVFGGQTTNLGSFVTVNEAYDPAGNTWTTKAAMPTARWKQVALTLGTKVYVVAGESGSQTGGTTVGTNEEYDTVSNTWATRAGLPSARAGPAGGFLDGKLYVMGGANVGNLSSTERYDPAMNSWSTMAALPTADATDGGFGTIGGKILVLGGYSNTRSRHYEYDGDADTWTARTPLPAGQFPNAPASAVVGGRLYVAGGCGSQGCAASTNYQYDPGVTTSFSGLTPNTLYSFKAKSRNLLGAESDPSPTLSTYTLANPPLSPQYDAVSAAALTLGWSANGNPAGTLYRAQISTDAFSTLNASSATLNMAAVFPGLSPNTTYHLRVESLNHNGIPTLFAAASATSTLAAPPVAAAASDIAATALTVQWGSNGNPGGTFYLAQVSTDNFSTLNASSRTLGVSAGFTDLASNTTHYLRVQSVNRNEVPTAYAAASPVATLAHPPALPEISGVTDTSAGLNWSANGNPSGTLYAAQISTDNFSTLNASSRTLNASAEFDALAPNTSHYLRVVSINRAGIATSFAAAFATSTLASAPTSPQLAAVGAASLTLAWSANSNPAGTLYLVQVSTDNFSTLNASSRTLGVSAGFADLASNTTHYLRVAAVNRHGIATAFSAASAAATLANAPASPQLAAVGASSLTLSWSVNSNPAGTLYLAQISTDDFATVNASSRTIGGSAVFAGLASNTTHFLRVAAVNHNGIATAFAAASAASTLAAPPVSAAPSEIAATSLTAQWGANGNRAGTVYEAQISTDSFATVNASSATRNTHAVFGGLLGDTAYDLRARAVGNDGTATAFVNLPSARTLPLTPAPAETTFLEVGLSGISVRWASGGNGPATIYTAQISTDAFVTINFSSTTRNLSAAFGSGGAGADLSPNTTHHLRVQSVGATNNSLFLVLGSTSTLANAPGAPQLGAVNSSSLGLSWSAGGNSAGTLYLAQISTDNFSTLNASSRTFNTSAVFSGLVPNTTYYLRAQALNYNGIPTAFAAASATATLAALPFTLSAAQITATAVTAQWGTNGNPAQTLYVAQVSTDNFATVNASSRTLGVSAVFAGLAANTTYYLRAQAINHNGIPTAFAAAQPVSTLAAPPASAAASEVTASGLTANWGANGNPAGTLYEAQISTDSFVTVNASSATRNTYAVFGGLLGDTSYALRVRAVGNGGTATAFTALPLAATSLLPPTAAAAAFPAVGALGLSAAWGGGGNGPATSYTAQISTDAFATVNLSSTTRSLSAAFGSGGVGADLLPNTTHHVRVQSVGASGASSFLSLGSTSTLANAPALPQLAAVGAASLTLSWSTNSNPVGTLYLAQVSTDNFATVNASSRTLGVSAVFAGLASNTTHYLRVAAVNHNGLATAFAAASAASTLANGPASPQLGAVGSSSLGLSWSAGGNSAGTLYLAQISTDNFSTLNASSRTLGVSAVFTGLAANTTHHLRVAALNHNGAATAFAAAQPVSTLAAPPASAAASEVTASSLTAQWGANGNRAGTVYEAQISTDAFATVNASSGTRNTHAAFGGLSPNTNYGLRARAVGNDGTATAFVTLPSVLTRLLAPALAARTFLSVSTSSVTASWDGGGNGPEAGFVVESSTDGFATINLAFTTPNSLATLGSGGAGEALMPNTTYYLRVHAASGSNASPFLSLGSTSTLALLPSSIALAAVNASSITVSWTAMPPAPSSSTAAGLRLEASEDPGFGGLVLSSAAGAGVASLVIEGLTTDTTYHLRLASLNRGGAAHYATLGSTMTFFPQNLRRAVVQNGGTLSVVLAPADPKITSIEVNVPPLAFPAGTVVVARNVSRMPSSRSSQAQMAPLGSATAIDLSAGGAQPSRPVAISMDYNPALLPVGADLRTLTMATYDPSAGQWSLLPTTVYPGSNRIVGLASHFSLFAPFIVTAASDFSQIRIFPVPWEPGSGSALFDTPHITFSRLPAQARVRIYSILGEFLWENFASLSGLAFWNGVTRHGTKVGSGTYLVVIEGNGSRITRRVVVIR